MLRTAARTEKMERAACWCAQGAPCVAVRCSELFEGQRTSDIAATETNEWRAIYSKFGLKKSVRIIKGKETFFFDEIVFLD